MSDKTNQATPTTEQLIERVRVLINSAEECSEYRDTASWGFEEGVLMTINEATTLADLAESAPSLLAENEKLRRLVERSSGWLEKTSAYTNYQPDFNEIMVLIGEITAALSGEQEGTPLK